MSDRKKYASVRALINALKRYAPKRAASRFPALLRDLDAAFCAQMRELEELRGRNAELAKAASLQKERILALQTNRREFTRTFEKHRITFDKFRSAIDVAQRMKSMEELPEVLGRLQAILNIPTVGLILCAEEFDDFAPESIPTHPAAAIEKALGFYTSWKTGAPHLGRINALPNPGFFLNGSSSRLSPKLTAGSCLISPLRNKYQPDAVTGVLSFFDPEPTRYAPEKVTDFLELFCETLAGAVLDVKNHERIDREKIIDELTGVHNRAYLNRHAPRLLQLSERKERPACLLFIDLDRFKAVNDTLGHDAGDAVLIASAKRIREAARAYDVFVRLGGDEFVILAPDTDKAEASVLAGRIRETLEALSVSACCGVDTDLGVSASIGVEEFRNGMSLDELIRRADGRMYKDKQENKTAG